MITNLFGYEDLTSFCIERGIPFPQIDYRCESYVRLVWDGPLWKIRTMWVCEHKRCADWEVTDQYSASHWDEREWNTTRLHSRDVWHYFGDNDDYELD